MINPKKISKKDVASERDRYTRILNSLGYSVDDDIDEADVIWFTGPKGLMYSAMFDNEGVRFLGIYLRSAISEFSADKIRRIESYIAEDFRVMKCWGGRRYPHNSI